MKEDQIIKSTLEESAQTFKNDMDVETMAKAAFFNDELKKKKKKKKKKRNK